MTCPVCGTASNPAAAKFCSHCGTALPGSVGSGGTHDPLPVPGNFDERFGAAAALASPPLAPESPPAVTPEMFFPWSRPAPAKPAKPSEPDPAPDPGDPQDTAAPPRPDPAPPSTATSIAGPCTAPELGEPIAAMTGAGPSFGRSEPGGVPDEPRSNESRYWATGAHASAFVGAWLGGVPAFIGPLIVWLARKDTDPFAAEHGRNALNFNLSVIVYVLAMAGFSIFTFGIGLLVTIPGFILLGLAWFALTLIGTIKAASSETYRYPLTIRFVK